MDDGLVFFSSFRLSLSSFFLTVEASVVDSSEAAAVWEAVEELVEVHDAPAKELSSGGGDIKTSCRTTWRGGGGGAGVESSAPVATHVVVHLLPSSSSSSSSSPPPPPPPCPMHEDEDDETGVHPSDVVVHPPMEEKAAGPSWGGGGVLLLLLLPHLSSSVRSAFFVSSWGGITSFSSRFNAHFSPRNDCRATVRCHGQQPPP